MEEDQNALEMKRKTFQPQHSSVQMKRQQAVCVRRAYKRYGTKKNPHVILDGLNMTVPKGTIYGLLGASGCGKTTLLSCIVGRKRLNSGEIWVLGGKPGSPGSGVPGPRIGYMPQEIALYGEFTIRETMTFFGWLANISTAKIQERLEFLINLLMLPCADKQVKTLSGGQQRRVSLAAALLHEPELLILDEPTVGVDPLLRQNIWNHLVNITKNAQTTVIITTHYIDETRQAHLIGLMRGGYFLAEECPERLITQFGVDSLEEVFLKLSVMQNRGKRRRSSIVQVITETITVPSGQVNEGAMLDEEVGEISGEFGDNVSTSGRSGRRVSIVQEDPHMLATDVPPEEEVQLTWQERLSFCKSNHMRALMWKNGLWMLRNIPILLFLIGLPMVQVILFCVAIGKDPRNLNVAVANYELEKFDDPCNFIGGCNTTRLSCNYISYLEKKTLRMHYFDTDESAKDMVRAGNAWAAVVFHKNFSQSLRARIDNGRDVEPDVLAEAEVQVYQDISNENIGTFLKRDLYFGFQDFFQDFVESCDINRKFATIPVRFNKPVYGPSSPNFTDFAAPGIILSIIFFLAVALTTGAMLIERNEGILERSLVNGITGVEQLLAHVCSQFVVMVIQTAIVVIFVFYVFNVTLVGSIGWVILLTLLTGLCGMCFGFVISCVCDTERTATYFALGSFLPIIMLCGIVWPIEAMHNILRFISFFLPLTKSTESIRSILAKGWGIDSSYVYEGFIATFFWIAIFLTLSILLLKFKKG